MSQLRLFKFTVDGCVHYWLAAGRAEDCKQIIIEMEGSDEFTGETQIDVVEFSCESAKATMLRSDDAPTGEERVSLWSIFETMSRPAVIGCSEW